MPSKVVEIVVTKSDPKEARVWGEVKARDEPGKPTIALVEARLTYNDKFLADPARYSYHFRVDRPAKFTLAAKADGTTVGTPMDYDATTITAGLRYHFTVPA